MFDVESSCSGNAGSRRVVLVIEDNSDDLYLLKLALTQVSGTPEYRFLRDATRAMEYLEEPSNPLPALILVDLRLPKVDGVEFVNWVRSQPRLRDLQVFVLSGADSPANLERAMQAGANRFLTKPTTFDGLVALLAELKWAVSPCAAEVST